MQGVSDPKKAAGIILQATGLADDAFRLGATKAWQIIYYFFLIRNVYIVQTWFRCEISALKLLESKYQPLHSISIQIIFTLIRLTLHHFNELTKLMILIVRPNYSVAFEWHLQQIIEK